MIEKKYCYAVLMMDKKNLTPEAKYVLIRILFVFGCVHVTNAVESLEKELGVSDEVLKKARDLLIELKYLIRMPVMSQMSLTSKKGRLIEGFQVSSILISELDVILQKELKIVQPDRLDRLLFWRQGVTQLIVTLSLYSQEVQPKPLSPSNRILLAVLYASSDVHGVVRDVGLSKIGKKSCMTLGRLESQIKILKKSNFILFHIAGLTGVRLFGKSSGAFFLNVFHNMIVSDTQSSTLVMCKTYFIDNYNDHFWAWRVFGPRFQIPPSVTSQCDSYKLKDLNLDVLAKESLIDIRNKLEGSVALADDELSKLESIFDLFKTPCGKGVFRWQSDFRFLKLHEVFQRELQYGECRYLQYKIEQYASELLCKYWPFLGITPLKIPEGFLEKIIEEIYPPSVRGSQYESSFLDLMAEGVGLFIYRISLHIALYAKGLVMAAFEKQPNSMVMLSEASYSVFPVAYNNGWANRFSVIVSFSRQLIETRYVLISVSKPKVYEYLKIDNNNLNELKSLMVDFGYMSL